MGFEPLIGKIMENYKCNPKRGKVKVIYINYFLAYLKTIINKLILIILLTFMVACDSIE